MDGKNLFQKVMGDADDLKTEIALMVMCEDKNQEIENSIQELIDYFNRTDSVISLQDFNKLKESLMKELHLNKEDALKAYMLRIAYIIYMYDMDKTAPLGFPYILDFVRSMLPYTRTYNKNFFIKSKWYKKINRNVESGGWYVDSEILDAGFMAYDFQMYQCDYVLREGIMFFTSNITIASIANDEKDLYYDVGPQYLRIANEMLEGAEKFKNVLILGLKAGCLLAELHEREGFAGNITVVEQDESLVEMIKESLVANFDNADNIKFVNEDHVAFVKANGKDYDLVLVDCYDSAYSRDAVEIYADLQPCFAKNEVNGRFYGESVLLGTVSTMLRYCAMNYAQVIPEELKDDDFCGFDDTDIDVSVPANIQKLFDAYVKKVGNGLRVLKLIQYQNIDNMFSEI